MTELSQKKCAPCRGDTPSLSEERITEFLQLVDGWTRVGQRIERQLSFTNYDQAMAFLNRIAEIAKREDHHPDMGIHDYRKVKLSLTTHAIKGLSDNDFIVAAKIDCLYREFKQIQ
jgi:4a-hydroxytetrahydrobiopterin dehydratase